MNMDTSKSTRVRLTSDVDSTYQLTILKTEGRRGINVRASYKTKDAPKAKAGCRSVHQNHEDADKAVQSLVAAAQQRGWTVSATEEKRKHVGAFTEIPLAPAAPAKKGK
jgi:hypothetical protein